MFKSLFYLEQTNILYTFIIRYIHTYTITLYDSNDI